MRTLGPQDERMVGADESTKPWSSLVEEDEQWICPTVKLVWNDAMDVLHYFWGLTKTQQLTAWAETVNL